MTWCFLGKYPALDEVLQTTQPPCPCPTPPVTSQYLQTTWHTLKDTQCGGLIDTIIFNGWRRFIHTSYGLTPPSHLSTFQLKNTMISLSCRLKGRKNHSERGGHNENSGMNKEKSRFWMCAVYIITLERRYPSPLKLNFIEVRFTKHTSLIKYTIQAKMTAWW